VNPHTPAWNGAAACTLRRVTTGALPTFLVIGAMKAGTTSFYDRLGTHPEVFLPGLKEPDFFVAEKAWDRGLAWYRSLFEVAGAATAVGEASTSYTKCTEFAGVAARIAHILPDVRLLYLVREPVARARSMHRHNVLAGRERRPLHQAVLDDGMYVGASSYALQLEQYLAVLPREQIHVVVTERFAADQQQVLDEVAGFLGVTPGHDWASHGRDRNVSAERRAETGAFRLACGSPLVRAVARRVPDVVVRRAYSALTRQVGPASEALPAGVEAELRARLADDTARFAELLGGPVAEWSATAR